MPYKVNPYTPGAGCIPGYLAGRENIMNDGQEVIEYLSHGLPQRSLILYGLRGVGKTVLLNTLDTIAFRQNVHHEFMKIVERRNSFKQNIILSTNKLMRQLSAKVKVEQYVQKALGVLGAFTKTYDQEGKIGVGFDNSLSELAVGVSDTGVFANDLTELFLALGGLAKETGKGIVIFIDEIQYLESEELEALIGAMHRINQKGMPLAVIGAGLPKIVKIAGDIKSYAERLFRFIEVGSLEHQAACGALERPAEMFAVSYTPEAVNHIISITQGYPYFLQAYGQKVWKHVSSEGLIDKKAVLAAQSEFYSELDKSFFKVRHDRATARELEFMLALAKMGKGPYVLSELVQRFGLKMSDISPLRAQLVHKGFIYAAKRGEVDFTVPQFDAYLRRVYEIEL